MAEEKERSIELDCAPGILRPSDLIDGVIEGTGLPKIETSSRFFGNWKWDYTKITTQEQWEKIQPLIKARITALYNSGTIRYGSW